MVSLIVTALLALWTLQGWERADLDTTRLPPAAFSNLPMDIRRDLERRRCTIPQPFGARDPQNVITGAFTRPGEIDWAVLCSVQRVSSILIYREGSVHNVDRLAASPDDTFLQVVGYDPGGTSIVGYSRAIGAADAKHILAHQSHFGGPKPSPIDHDGIEDNFVEKGSSIFYWHNGRWLTLTGMD